MIHELETAAVASLGGWLRRRPAAPHTPVGSPCANCGVVLQGPWCHACGQSAEDLHRSLRLLSIEAVEGLLHFDGRFWRTLPDLILHPGRLTRRYLEGHRVPQIPPLRLFLVILLLVFFAGSMSASSGRPGDGGTKDVVVRLARLSPEKRAVIEAQLNQSKIELAGHKSEAASDWLRGRLKSALEDPERFMSVMESWSERFAFLLLPMSTLFLSVLFVLQRRFYVFDHAIFSLHSLSAMGLLLTLVMLLDGVTRGAAGWLLWAAPVHLFVHMRGVYGASVVGTLVRMALLFVASAIGFTVLIIGLIGVGLTLVGAR